MKYVYFITAEAEDGLYYPETTFEVIAENADEALKQAKKIIVVKNSSVEYIFKIKKISSFKYQELLSNQNIKQEDES